MNGDKTIPAAPRVRFELVKAGADRLRLVLSGELDADSVPRLWEELQREFAATPVSALEVDAAGLTYCDSAGLALLYALSTGQMTPQAQVTLGGLNPELQKELQSFSLEDYQALSERQPACQPLPEEVGTVVVEVAQGWEETVAFIGHV